MENLIGIDYTEVLIKDDIFIRVYANGVKTIIRDRPDIIEDFYNDDFKLVFKNFEIFTGIILPHYRFIFDSQRNHHVIEVEYIEGINLGEMSSSDELFLKYGQLYEELVSMYLHYLDYCFKFNKPFISDFKGSQLILSHDNKIYFIDLDFFVGLPYGYLYKRNILTSVYPRESEFYSIILELEEIVNKLKEIGFCKAQDKFQAFLFELNISLETIRKSQMRMIKDNRELLYGNQLYT